MSLEGEEEEETSCGSPKSVAKQYWNYKLLPMNLLDEYWFFHNTLHSSRRVLVPQSPFPLADSKSKEMSLISSTDHQHTKAEKSPVGDSFADRALLRGPKETATVEENDEEDVVDVTRTSTSSSTPNTNRKPPLLRAPSMPSPQNSVNYFDSSSSSSPKKNLMRNASMGRHQLPRRMRKCCCTSLHYNNYERAFQEKKWRSSSDLESIEVQGFKDLGFVFDEAAGPSDESLASVIPGLREKKAPAVDDDGGGGGSDVKRPYLSEAWNAQRSAPPTVKWAADKRSAADMKEQLKFWARAVACNVRQEC